MNLKDLPASDPIALGNRFDIPFLVRVFSESETAIMTYICAYLIGDKVTLIQAGDNDYIELTMAGWQAFVDGETVTDGINDASSMGEDWKVDELERLSPLPWQDGFSEIPDSAWASFRELGELPFSASQTSIKTTMVIAYQLACQLAYDGSTVLDTTKRYGKDDSDLIWGFVDGLYQQWFQKRMDGQCSPQASMDFDMEKQEKQLNIYVQKFLDLDMQPVAI